MFSRISSTIKKKSSFKKMNQMQMKTFSNFDLTNAITDFQKRLKQSRNFQQSNLMFNTRYSRKRDDFDTQNFKRFAQIQEKWSIQSRILAKKINRPSSQDTLISTSEKFVQKQSIANRNSVMKKNLSMKLLNWEGSLRQNNPGELQDRYIPVGKPPYSIFSKVPKMVKNNSEVIIKPSKLFTIKNMREGVGESPHKSYFALKSNPKQQEMFSKMDELMVTGFNKIKKVRILFILGNSVRNLDPPREASSRRKYS
jgi:hypothetical protein